VKMCKVRIVPQDAAAVTVVMAVTGESDPMRDPVHASAIPDTHFIFRAALAVLDSRINMGFLRRESGAKVNRCVSGPYRA
jgi:hypothetical protein